MDTARKWSFRIQITLNALAGLLNIGVAYRPLRDGNGLVAGFSMIMAVACSVTAWLIVRMEQRHRVEQATRESYLKEQLADTQLKEEMLLHFKQLRASGQAIEFGLPILSTRRPH